MRWPTDRLPNVKTVMDRYRLLDRTLLRNREKINAAGSPCIYYKNMSLDVLGRFPANATKCYCWTTPDGTSTQQVTPDRSHFVCMGTGMLGTPDQPGVGGYQRYGYEEIVFTTVHQFTKSSNNLIISGSRNSVISISGNSLAETFTTDRYSLPFFKEVDYFLINESIDSDKNRIDFQYSTDDITWNTLTLIDYTHSRLANKQAFFQLPEYTSTGFTSTGGIRFRATLRKKTTLMPSPQFNCFRFRYRNQKNLCEIDERFLDITRPAFLAAREQQTKEIFQSEHGWSTRFPIKWWVLPEVALENEDVIRFIKGTFADQFFVAKNITKYTYGENLQILHRGFESGQIRDRNDILGIIFYLL